MAENNDRIKVVGYAQRVFFNDGIEYRNFSDDLVGNQQVQDSDENASLFTMGNFVVSTNISGRITRNFNTKKFTNFFNLNALNLTETSANELLENNVTVTLNLDNSELCNYAYFGSATEFVRVSLEKIITNWPASLYLQPTRDTDFETLTGYTVQDYSFDSFNNKSSFKVDTDFIINNFNIVYEENGSTIDTFNESNDLRNLTVNFSSYVILNNDIEYKILEFTPSETTRDSFIELVVEGDPFATTGSSTNQFITYHIKPKNELVDTFFNSLSPFEDNLLNRLVIPKYTSNFEFQVESDNGVIITQKKTLTWPVTDGYNIDFNTVDYAEYVTDLLDITTSKDSVNSNLIARFLTSESISDFDTIPNCDGGEEETAGQKMNKTLKIYGREYDEVKKYIDGIAYANVVTYNKKDNTPDQILKYLARTLGWELTSSVLENNLLTNYVSAGQSSYSGQTRGLTPTESEYELWRRLILNSAWIWKSKGTRKAIEFLFKFIGAPDGLVSLNEYIYVAKDKIDMEIFNLILENNNLDTDLSNYNVDSEGYPKFFRDTSSMYFQKGGLWYRETGGSGATEYLLTGNNPHVGPYDGGKEYLNQLQNLIPTFTAFTVTSTTISDSVNEQLFTNYNNGLINNYDGDIFVDLNSPDGLNLDDCFLVTTSVVDDPHPTGEETDCGCDLEEDDQALLVDIDKVELTDQQIRNKCSEEIQTFVNDPDTNSYVFNFNQYEFSNSTPSGKGSVLPNRSYSTSYASVTCCEKLARGNPFKYDDWNADFSSNTARLDNSGYVCCKNSKGTDVDVGRNGGCGCFLSCKWILAGPKLVNMYSFNGEKYLKFATPKNTWGNSGKPEFRVVNEADSCFCPPSWTTTEIITDPFTGKEGYACKLNNEGRVVLSRNASNPTYGTELNPLYQLFFKKATGIIDCNKQTP